MTKFLILFFIIFSLDAKCAEIFPLPRGWKILDVSVIDKDEAREKAVDDEVLYDKNFDKNQSKFYLLAAEGDFDGDRRKDVVRLFTKIIDGHETLALIATLNKGNGKYKHYIVEESVYSNPTITAESLRINERVCNDENGNIAPEVLMKEIGEWNVAKCRKFKWQGISIRLYSLHQCAQSSSYIWNGRKFIGYHTSADGGC